MPDIKRPLGPQRGGKPNPGTESSLTLSWREPDSNFRYLWQGAALSELIWRLRPRGLPALPVRQPTRRRSVLPVSKCRGGKSNEDLCSFVHRRNRRFESLFLRLLPIRSSRSQFLSKQQCSQGDVITRNTEAHWNCSSCSRG